MRKFILLQRRNVRRYFVSGIGVFSVFALLRRLPVYPDEEQWLYVNSRQSIDHLMQYLFPACEEGFQLNQPVLWVPIRGLNWLIYTYFSQIMNLRAVGLVQALLFMIVYWKFLGFFARNGKEAKTIAFGVLCLGLIPFLVILNRPEQQLVLLFFCALNISVSLNKSASLTRQIILGGFFTLLVVSMPAIHPKGSLFSLAVCAISLLGASKKTFWLSIPACLAGVISSVNSIQVWSTRTSCEQSGFLNSIFQTITINPSDLHLSSARMVAGNLIRTPKYLINIFYQNNYQSNWLAQKSQIPIAYQILADAALILVVSLTLLSLFLHFANAFRKREKLNQVDYISIIFIGMFGVLTTLQRTKNFYDSYLPIILLLSAAIIVRREGHLISHEKIKKSLAVVIILTVPAFISTSLNFIETDVREQKTTYKLIVQECGITEDELSKGGFIIDGSLTKYFWASPKFIYSSYVWGWWAQDVDAEMLIKRLKPPVIIVRNDGTLIRKTSDFVVKDFLCRKHN